MIVRYLPVILILAAIVLALAPLEAAAQADQAPSAAPPRSHDAARPKRPGAPVNADADKKALPPGSDPRQVRPAETFPPERIQTPQAPSRGGIQSPDPAAATAPVKDDPRSVEERPDPGG